MPQKCVWLLAGCLVLIAGGIAESQPKPGTPPVAESGKPQPAIDFDKAYKLFQRRKGGEKLSAEDNAYVERALEARQKQNGRPGALTPRETMGFKPLTEMSATDHYKGQDGGLYGGGQNVPPAAHALAAEQALARIEPLDPQGKPAPDGKVVFISISMSNATQEFSKFKQIADADPVKSKQLTIVDCAQGGQAMAEWVSPQAPPWIQAEQRLSNARVSPPQVQIAWVKLANKGPRGDLEEHGRKLQRDTQAVIQNAKARFPNLRIIYLSSRIYGGYTTGVLNPEPYAYESAFAVRWLIQDQIAGAATLNHDPDKGEVKAPLLLWGPYLWADGTTPRVADKLTYARADLAGDGTHPSEAGREKVARLMLHFYQTDPLAKSWFVR
jgi:hypothetical protein